MNSNQRAILPNFLTLSNLFLGFFAVVLFSQGKDLTGAWLIVIAAIFDGLDGAAARLAKSSSKFGREADSLADVVSFGVAPATLVFHRLVDAFGMWAVVPASLPLITAAIRLTRYNILTETGGHSRIFSGMPSPSGALMFASFFIYAHNADYDLNATPIWLTLIPLISALMVSPIPYRRMPVVPLHGAKRPALSIAAIIAATTLLLIDMPLFLFPLMVVYLLTGPVEWVILLVVQARERHPERIKTTETSTRTSRWRKRTR